MSILQPYNFTMATNNIVQEPIAQKKNTYLVPLIVLTSLFFMWGFLRSMTDVIIPYFRKLFTLNYAQSMLVQFCFLGAYFIGSIIYYSISLKKGDPIQRIGYKKSVLIGITLSTMGCLLFLPASYFASYPLFLFALLILGFGFTLLEITANAFVTLLGSEETASGRLNLTQAFNSLGTTLGPLIGGYMIFTLFTNPQTGVPTENAARIPYLIFACIFIVLGILIALVKFPKLTNSNTEIEKIEGKGAWQFPQLKLGMLGIFFYNGAETGIGSFIIVLLEQKFGFSDAISKNYVSLYWGGAMIGRFLAPIAFNKTMSLGKRLIYMIGIALLVFGVLSLINPLSLHDIQFLLYFIALNIIGFILGKRNAGLTLAIFAIISAAFVLIGATSDNHWIIYTFLAIGLFNSIMFSNIYTLGITGLGKHASQGSSLLIMAILGGGLLSFVQGIIADKYGVQTSFLLHVISYSYLVFFGLYCFKNLKKYLG
ncbi:sugar MFS transporter [Rhizosphaericola mali]|nr:sugar MFS transporter [Rhizosphaericola mali]